MPFPELEMWIGSECSKALFHNAAVPLAFYQKIILSVGLLIPVAPGTGVAVNRKRLDVLLVLGWEWQRVKAPKKGPGERREEIFQDRISRDEGVG